VKLFSLAIGEVSYYFQKAYFVTAKHPWPPETQIDGKRTTLWLKQRIRKGQRKRFDNFEMFVVVNIGSCDK
jgi:hypothetical protein